MVPVAGQLEVAVENSTNCGILMTLKTIQVDERKSADECNCAQGRHGMRVINTLTASCAIYGTRQLVSTCILRHMWYTLWNLQYCFKIIFLVTVSLFCQNEPLVLYHICRTVFIEVYVCTYLNGAEHDLSLHWLAANWRDAGLNKMQAGQTGLSQRCGQSVKV